MKTEEHKCCSEDLMKLRESEQSGWKEAAIAWEVCGSIHEAFAKKKDALYSTRHSDFKRHAEDARRMLSTESKEKGESRMSHDHSQNHYGPNASFDGYDSDLASAGILIESLRQQLAAALAACKLKDEALRELDQLIPVGATIAALAIQPDDAALKAWLGESVAKKIKYGALQFLAGYSELPPNTELYSPKGLK